MAVTRSLVFLILAIVCFAVALLLAVDVFAGSDSEAWEAGGLLSLALSFLL